MTTTVHAKGAEVIMPSSCLLENFLRFHLQDKHNASYLFKEQGLAYQTEGKNRKRMENETRNVEIFLEKRKLSRIKR